MYKASRIIFLWHHGYLPEIVDHIDRNSSNDNIENLRAATRMQNNSNITSAKNSTSKYLVSLKKGSNKWIAQIKSNGIVFHLGTYKTQEEAAIAYNNAAVNHHSNFSNLNII